MISGGDGTFFQNMNALLKTHRGESTNEQILEEEIDLSTPPQSAPLRVAIIPAGTGNDFYTSMGGDQTTYKTELPL